MSKLSKLKGLVLVGMIVLVLTISTTAYASDLVLIDDGASDNVTTPSDVFGNSADNEINDVNILENEVPEDNEMPEEEIPEAGRNDTILISIIGILAVSAIYTHVKIKKYNF